MSSDKTLLSTVIGGFDPILRQLAQDLAAIVPENSVFRSSKFTESLIGMLKGNIEAKAEAYSPMKSVLVEKATDLVDFFQGAASGNPKQKENASVWLKDFMSYARERLAKSSDHRAESERLVEELQALVNLELMEKESRKSDKETATELISRTASSFGKGLGSSLKELRNWAESLPGAKTGKPFIKEKR